MWRRGGKLVFENFGEKYGGDWKRLKAEVESIGRSDEDEKDEVGRYTTATAKVHLIVKAEVVIEEWAFKHSKNLWKVTATRASEVGDGAFSGCVNLIEAVLPATNSVGKYSFEFCYKLPNLRLPNATSIGHSSFGSCYALRHITLHPDVKIAEYAFFGPLSLEVLATCAGFRVDTGYYDEDGYLNPTVAITNYLKSQCELDTQQRDVFLTYNFMLKLCKHHIYKKTGVVRAKPIKRYSLTMFLFNNEDLASHILSFFVMKWGEKDLRNASKERLLELGL
eukprot:CAMPEP_0118638272 /NCGR_PEP_ID=MMETSP0785-20121206/3588_1 /TAXON_ID=91992 /ORGANISM="Bolidomonas pacifica, Strain CCMP 1866" /LENGTH=278 /DNA_ID=CAMNT_0006529495 /DNA_START=245 /DNA_END=1082 /DNA_ORIENTATION=-